MRISAVLSVGQSHPSEYKSNLIRYQRKIRRGSIRSARKSCQAFVLSLLFMREGSCKGDILVAGVEELQENDSSEVSKESIQKEVSCRKKENIFIFPCANGSVKLAGEGSEVRLSDRIRQDTEEGVEHRSDLQ